MRPIDRKRLKPPSGVRVRLQGHPGKPRGRSSRGRSLGVVMLIVAAAGVTAVSRLLPHGAGESKAPAVPVGGAHVSKPQGRASAPVSGSAPTASPMPAVSAKPAAPSPRPDGNASSAGAPRTATRPVTKAANGTAKTGSASKVAPGASVAGDSLIVNGGRRYRIRVGEFADRQPAEELKTRLRALGYAARIVGAQPFLVLVGGYLDEPTAGRLVSHLRDQGFDAVMNPANAPQ